MIKKLQTLELFNIIKYYIVNDIDFLDVFFIEERNVLKFIPSAEPKKIENKENKEKKEGTNEKFEIKLEDIW